MSKADRNSTRFTTRLSSLIRDPFVRAAFQRAERDYDFDDSFAVNDHPPCLDSGAAELLTCGARRIPVLEVA